MHTYTHTNADKDVESDDVWVPERVDCYTPWPRERGQRKVEVDYAAKHNDNLSGRIFEQVLKKKGSLSERRKYPLDTLKWYASVFMQSDLIADVLDTHTARAKLRKWFKCGTNTV